MFLNRSGLINSRATLPLFTRNAEARKKLLRPFPSSEMVGYPVGPQVNSPQSQGPGLIRRQGANSA